MPGYSWTCPYCNRPTTITQGDCASAYLDLMLKNADGKRRLGTKFTVCPNPECKKASLEAKLWTLQMVNKEWVGCDMIYHWQLIPPSKAKPFPNYIPEALRKDYGEACLIADLSPNASATLARRCLQGIVWDFWDVKGRTLYDQIDQLKDDIDPLVWRAMDAVRKMGNVGAHMQEDVNLIVDVDPDESRLLIRMIEMLFSDCYVARHEKQETLRQITEAAEGKEPPPKDGQ